jgi:subfamily B ATP-binding cassette protein MsbA
VPTSAQPPYRLVARLLGYARPYVPLVLLAIVFSLIYAGGLTGQRALIQPMVDGIAVPSLEIDSVGDLFEYGSEAAPAEQVDVETRMLLENIRENAWLLFVACIALVLGMPLVKLIRDYSGQWLMIRMFVDLQRDIGTKLLHLPLSHHSRYGTGDFVSRSTNDAMIANRAQALIFGELIQDAAIVLGAGAGALWINWRLALVALVAGPPVALIMQVFGRRIRKRSARRQLQISEVMQRILQMLSGIKIIKAFRAEATERDAFEREIFRYFRRAMSVERNRVSSRVSVEMASQLSLVTLLLVGTWVLIHRMWGLTLGQLLAFSFIAALMHRPMKNMTRLYNAVQDAIPGAIRIFELLDAPEEPEDRADARPIERLEQGIRFEDVSFSYGRERVLEGVSLEIRTGEVVALVGRTGAGKTTLADLLVGFYRPTSGTICYDGVDLRDLQRDSVRDLFAIVTQDAFLFDMTLLENIRYGRPDASFEEVVEAARAANAHDFIEEFPEGYETRVGERGAQLSGGQRQRITIARAILCDPQVLIFDEATSALDAKSERLVQDAIANLLKGRTVVVIAHRLATVRAADHIFVVEQGRVAMTGTHDELLARGGLYRELVQLQSVESSAPDSPEAGSESTSPL